MEVLLAQLCPVAGDVPANAERVADVVRNNPGADLAVFPELFLSGYDLAQAPSLALEAGAAEIDPVRNAAAETGTAVIVGFVERGAAGAVHNSVLVVDAAGAVAAVYRKLQLFGAERDAFDPGDQLLVVSLAGSRVGLLICFDAEFPELARALAAKGAQMLVTTAANMRPYYGDHELATRARALDNRRPHVYVNRVGTEAGMQFVGGSRVIAPDGTVRMQFPEQDEAVSIATVVLSEEDDEAVQYLAQVPERFPVRLIDSVLRGST